MNSGVVEEGGSTARTLIDSLKNQPATLALVVFNIIFIAAVLYASSENRKTVNKLLDQQVEFSKMLYNCTPNKSILNVPLFSPTKATTEGTQP